MAAVATPTIHLKRDFFWIWQAAIEQMGMPHKVFIQVQGDRLMVVPSARGRKIQHHNEAWYVKVPAYSSLRNKDIHYGFDRVTQGDEGTVYWFKNREA